MALQFMKSNLKNLKFGKDTQGGGSSGLPYIKPGLPEDSPAGEYLAGIARTSADFPLRGGTYSTIASTEDTIRISRFLTDFPKGAIFTSKQVGLQKSNPKIETGEIGGRLNTQTYNLNANLLAQVFEQGTGIHINRAGFNTNELNNDRNKYAYIVKNKTTEQNRLVNLFNTKISGETDSNIASNKTALGIANSNDFLFQYVGGPDSNFGDGETIISRTTNTPESWKTYKTKGYSNSKISPTDTLTNQLITKGNDPLEAQTLASGKFNSILRKKFPRKFQTQKITEEFNTDLSLDGSGGNGTGQTVDAYVKQETLQSGYLDNFIENGDTLAQQGGTEISGDFIRPEATPAGVPTINQFNNTMGYSALLAAKGDDMSVTTLNDFRQLTSSPQKRNYSDQLVNLTTRVGIGSPGARTDFQRKGTNIVVDGGQDKVNMIPLYTDDTNPFETSAYGTSGNKDARDLIKFAFEVIDNDNPKNTTKVHFRAFLTNFSDNHSADWNGQKYMGRGEKFYTYQGFDRQVSFQFKVAAQSKQEMMPLYQKLNYIVSSLYPDYSGQGFMRGNLHKLTIGEYFYRTPGIITSMNITVDDNYPWEIKYSEPETENKFSTDEFPSDFSPNGSTDFFYSNSDADMMELPQVLNVSVSFIPILNELPALSKVATNDRRGILISNDVGREENFINRIGLKFKKPEINFEVENPPEINSPNT